VKIISNGFGLFVSNALVVSSKPTGDRLYQYHQLFLCHFFSRFLEKYAKHLTDYPYWLKLRVDTKKGRTIDTLD